MKKFSKKQIGFIVGIVGFITISFLFNLDKDNPLVSYTMGITFLMATWWILEVIPLAITALIPIILFPIFGIANGKEISSAYFNDIIFLFIGGFMIALAMQKWNLHTRIALNILQKTGVSPTRIVAGFMIASAFLSMWISNTATTMMMLPIAISILNELENNFAKKDLQKYSIALLLAIAYSSSIGGIATLVGTAPNMVLVKIFSITFPNSPDISFGQWMIFAFPLSLSLLIILLIFLYLYYFRKVKLNDVNKTNIIIKKQYKNLGKTSYEEKIVMIIFILFAGLLLFRKDIIIGNFTIYGWSNIFNYPKFINDGTIAIFTGVLMFTIPSKNKKNDFILDWETTKKIPWDIILLFGGGFALATGFISSGLSLWIGNELSNIIGNNYLINIIIVTSVMIFLTEVTSNTATTQILLPVIAAMAVSVGNNPLLLMIPATIAASMAFMLPVATPPNAIVFSSGKIKISEMAKTGLVMNIIAIIVVSLFVWLVGIDTFATKINP